MKRDKFYYRQDGGAGTSGPVQQSGSPAPGQTGGQQGGQPAQQQPQGNQDPWRQHLPEQLRSKSIDDVAKSYGELHKKLGEQGTEMATLRKSADEGRQYQAHAQKWGEWWQQAQPHWSKFQEWMQTQGQGGDASPQQAAQSMAQQMGTGVPQTQQMQQVFANWDNMTPQQQYSAMLDAMTGQVQSIFQTQQKTYEQQMHTQNQAIQKQLAEREQYWANYIKLQNTVGELRRQYPNMDVNQVLQKAIEISSGKADPIELGLKLVQGDAPYEERLAKQKEIWLQEQQQQQMQQALQQPATSGTPPAYKPNLSPNQGGAASLRQSVAKQLAEKFGMGIFSEG